MALPTSGILAEYSVKQEATFDTPLAFVAADCVALLDMKLEPTQELIDSQEHAFGSRDLITRIKGKRGGKWSAKGYIRTPAAGSAPDLAAFLKAANMTETLNASTSAVYTLDSLAPRSLQLVQHLGSNCQEVANGAWVESVKISIEGGGVPTIEFSGGFASYGGLRGSPIVEGAVSSSGTSVVLETTSAYLIRPGARVAFGTETNSGNGYVVTAVSSDGLTCTISPGLAAGISDGVAVTAHFPSSPTVNGTIQGAVADGCTISSNAVGFISLDFTYETGIHGLDKEATTDRANRLALGKFGAKGTAEFYLLDENASIQADTWNLTTRAMSFRVGPNTASNRCTLALAAAMLEVASLEVPEADEVTYKSQFTCVRSSAVDDSFTLTFS